MALGDTLAALGRTPDAKPIYQRALAIAATMEPSAAADWSKQIQQKLGQ